MHYFLRNAVKDVIAYAERTDVHRSDEEAAQARETARAGRRLLLHDSPNDLVERWLDAHLPPLTATQKDLTP